ncbi:hypothetical protein [Burkholderia pyrrocinia]
MEFAHLALGDARLNKRARALVGATGHSCPSTDIMAFVIERS